MPWRVHPIPVSHPSPRDLTAALRLFVGGEPGAEQDLQVERCRQALNGGGFDPEGLFVSHDAAGSVNGVALVQALPGALGVAWPPRAESAALEDELALTACDWLRSRGVKLCQAFASPSDRAPLAPLERNGFHHTTQLAFLNRRTDEVFPEDCQSGVRCSRVSAELSVEARRVLLDTHIATLDCPELVAARTPEEIVGGFLDEADCSWHEIRTAEQLVGVLLLEKAPDASALELSYLGIIPEERGKGIGASAMEYALRFAAESGYQRLCLSVDIRNLPALRLYRGCGFVETHRHDVFLAEWTRSS